MKITSKQIAIGLGLSGLALFVFEILGASDDEEGGTISEFFWSLPEPVKYFIAWVQGGVFVHLIRWGRKVIKESQ